MGKPKKFIPRPPRPKFKKKFIRTRTHRMAKVVQNSLNEAGFKVVITGLSFSEFPDRFEVSYWNANKPLSV